MRKSYLVVEEIDNGFTIRLNEYSQTNNNRIFKVARNTTELHEILQEIFPVESPPSLETLLNMSNEELAG